MQEENDHFKYKPQAYIIYPSCLYISGSFLTRLFSISVATSTVVHQYKYASIRPDHNIPTPVENSDTICSFNVKKQRGSDFLGKRGRWKTISLVLSVLTVSLFSLDQSRMWENSASRVVEEFWGTSKVVSSAYLRIVLKDEWGLRSMV